MSSRAIQSLRYTPRFVCSQCLFVPHKPASPSAFLPPHLLYQPARRWKSQLKQAPREAAPASKKSIDQGFPESFEEAKKTLNVRYFEQESDGDLRELQSSDDFARSLDGTELYQQDLENDLESIMDIVDGKNTNERFRAQLEKELLNAIEESKRRSTEATPEGQATKAATETPQINEKTFRKEAQRRLVRKLNSALDRAEKANRRDNAPSKRTLVPLWKTYVAARQTLALSWNAVPRATWDMLWRLFSIEDPVGNPNRLSHVATLSKDMSAAGIDLTPSQQILTIESLFVENWENDAVKNWKRCLPKLGADHSSSFQQFWELGVRMFCQTGDMEQANRATERLLNAKSDPRILMTLIRTYSQMGTEEAYTQAWEAYRRLRGLLGSQMKLEDYDQVISHFLAANQTDNALHAFVDMMTSGTTDLKKHKRLPPTVGNKFFFGKWLKRLIGAGELDGAYNVIKFMLQKRVQPAPIHVNGLIGAWQRAGGERDLENADAVAWQMIESRLRFVRERRGEQTAEQDSAASTPWPRATLETFSLMAENYRLRQQHDSLMRLWQAFNEAEITHDAFMMNQLLESYLQYGRVAEGAELYKSLVSGGRVKPNPHTFMTLWKMLDVNRIHISQDQYYCEMENARNTFNEMMKFVDVFDEPIDGQLARKILHTFRRLHDSHGFLVALTSLRNTFGFLPPELLVLELVVGTTNLAWDTLRARQRLRIEKKRMDLDIMQRREALGKFSGSVNELEELSAEERGEELYEYLVRVYTPVRSEEDKEFIDDTQLLEEAAQQMGVYNEATSGE
ncbi:hypothetical protein jhhlp_007391 [Lomentospora prolificans]|uniref:Pentacotripeptide-repeat region of PRORP domain-containing protein n=1 Tax=Lomentospora prolificans TaxID=41688 RepID=A0A2N3N2I8_9PEZI|nr:hypothetical protein jhhlp_007391 [Lomentospora prolificans]